MGELPCHFFIYLQGSGLTGQARNDADNFLKCVRIRWSVKSANGLALHSQSARPTEIRPRLSFLLPPLFAPGRCAASFFSAWLTAQPATHAHG